ncbi:MAG: hypothetical protein H7641_09545 [Candidatus Heimdallarchaeota archaeon]|nr:hypothetical protein [Candidatus Heimdallarchaeota archaeon]MCK4877807.1 hypothetical protein [Candidatus Heimdallarchaeota archaeon]
MVDIQGILTILSELAFPIIIGLIIFSVIRRRKRRRVKRRPAYTVPTRTAVSTYQTSVNLNNIINNLNASEHNLERASNGFSFVVPQKHKYSLFTRIKIIQFSSNSIKVFGTLNKQFPSFLDVLRRDNRIITNKDEFNIPLLSNVYYLFSSTPPIWKEVLKNEQINDYFLALRAYLDYFYLRSDYLEAVLYSDTAVITLLNLSVLLHDSLKSLFSGTDEQEVELLSCYNCQDPFDPTEEICDKCGVPRPRCIICNLDLKPSEKEEVVNTPCCGVYTHKNHIISWLKQKSSCPNCHAELGHWLSKLQLI